MEDRLVRKQRLWQFVGVLGISCFSMQWVYAEPIDDDIVQKDKKIEHLTVQEQSLTAELQQIDQEIQEILAEAAVLEQQQLTIRDQIQSLTEAMDELQIRIEEREQVIRDQARSMQVDGPDQKLLSYILNSESVTRVLTRVVAANKLVSAQQHMMQQQEADKQLLADKQHQLEEKLQALQKNITTLERKKNDLETKQRNSEILKQTIALEKETEQAKRAELIQKKERLEQERKEQERLNELAQAQARQVQEQQKQDNQPAAAALVQASASVQGIPATAAQYLGVPYVWGGSTPSGFDCSGFTQYVFAQNGVSLPRVTTAQEFSGTVVPINQLSPGDLVFFGPRGATYHVGIYTGNGQYIHAPQPGESVKYTSISDYTPSFGVRVL